MTVERRMVIEHVMLDLRDTERDRDAWKDLAEYLMRERVDLYRQMMRATIRAERFQAANRIFFGKDRQRGRAA